MTFINYLKDNVIKLLLYLALAFATITILITFQLNPTATIIIATFFVIFGIALLFYDFLRKRTFYISLQTTLAELDQKHLLAEMLNKPHFLEGQIIYDALYETNKSLAEAINTHERHAKEFQNYIELWVHEIKTPLTSLTLSLHDNNKNNREAKIYLEAIENYINQALFYSKVGSLKGKLDKDYIIKRINLETVVNTVIKNNKDNLIKNHIQIETKGLKLTVLSDPKWLEFIINQILLNSIKYRRTQHPQITITAEEINQQITLKVHDNGIGIKPSELRHVFKKAFTGSNDRKQKTSTGMGLFISDQLSRDMGHKLQINSTENQFTEVQITFGNDNFFIPPARKSR